MEKMPDMLILHTCTINENHIMYGSWDMESDRQNYFGPIFFPFYLFSNQQNYHFEKLKKALGDIIILHLGNTNDNFMMWFLRYGAQWTELFVILDQFLSFYPKHLRVFSRPLLGGTIAPNLVPWFLRKIFPLEMVENGICLGDASK